MRVREFLLSAAFITTIALGYVHQQIELVRINYTINRNRSNLAVLLDQNSTLLYNIVNLQTPFYLEKSLEADNDSWEIPSRWYTIGLAEAAK